MGILVRGRVLYRERIALLPQALVDVRVMDVTDPSAPMLVGRTAFQAGGRQVPIDFEVEVDPTLMDARSDYVVEANVYLDGRLTWAQARAAPVLTKGHPVEVELLLLRHLEP